MPRVPGRPYGMLPVESNMSGPYRHGAGAGPKTRPNAVRQMAAMRLPNAESAPRRDPPAMRRPRGQLFLASRASRRVMQKVPKETPHTRAMVVDTQAPIPSLGQDAPAVQLLTRSQEFLQKRGYVGRLMCSALLSSASTTFTGLQNFYFRATGSTPDQPCSGGVSTGHRMRRLSLKAHMPATSVPPKSLPFPASQEWYSVCWEKLSLLTTTPSFFRAISRR